MKWLIGPKNDAKIEETDRLDQWEESVEAVESESRALFTQVTRKGFFSLSEMSLIKIIKKCSKILKLEN